jgi:phosphoribosylglycinamide formyltransferase 1
VNRRIAVLISGRGSNLQSIIDATKSGALNATIAVVISNRAEAAGLARARAAGIETVILSPRDYAGRDEYDAAIVDVLRAHDVSLVCLAGFMRLVGTAMLDAFPNRILNIHPSLLPAFRGLEAQRQALEHGVRISGATVHVVTSDLDAGPIVMQAAVPVMPDDTVDTLAARVLVEEHRIYPQAIAAVLNGVRPGIVTSLSPLAALVTAIPFAPDEALKIVELRAGIGDTTRAVQHKFSHATMKTFEDRFDVASLAWWDVMFGADLVIAPFVMSKLNDAKKQYLYRAIADRVSPRGGVLVVDRVDGDRAPLLHQLMWLKHAGFHQVDCWWLVDGVGVFGGFTPRRDAASGSPPPAGN